jgi:hypothetical protein
MIELKKIYEEAGKLIATEIRAAQLDGASDLTIASKQAIEQQLGDAAQRINDQLQKDIPGAIRKGASRSSDINVDYLRDAIKTAGVERITKVGLQNMAVAVNEELVMSYVNRVLEDGYSLSDRVWKVGEKFRADINNTIASGLAQGRSTIQIAKDVQVYIKDGKRVLAKRYGPNLEQGTREFLKRIGIKVDARALRLVRSELYASLQEVAGEHGRMNPACQDLYDWVLEAGRQHWNCGCEDAASGSPYRYADLPSYLHPNCRCQVRPVLMKWNDFIADLKEWDAGGQVDYIEDWYNTFYLTNIA